MGAPVGAPKVDQSIARDAYQSSLQFVTVALFVTVDVTATAAGPHTLLCGPSGVPRLASAGDENLEMKGQAA